MGRLVTWSRSIFKRFGSERLQLKLPTYFTGYGWQRSVKLVQLQFLGHPAVKTLPKQSQKSGAGFWLANTCEIVVTPASMEGTRWILSSLYLFQLLDCGCVGPLSWKVSSLQTVFRICIFIKVGVSVLLTVLFFAELLSQRWTSTICHGVAQGHSLGVGACMCHTPGLHSFHLPGSHARNWCARGYSRGFLLGGLETMWLQRELPQYLRWIDMQAIENLCKVIAVSLERFISNYSEMY